MIGLPDHMKRELLERPIVLDAVDRRPARRAARLGWRLRSIRPPSGGHEGDTAQSLVGRALSVLRVHEPSLEEGTPFQRLEGGGRAPTSSRRDGCRIRARCGAIATFAIALRGRSERHNLV
jgi:hypothetical protein